MAISPDHTRAAWSFDGNGAEFFELRVRELASGTDVADVLENTAGGAEWAADGKSFYTTSELDGESSAPVHQYAFTVSAPILSGDYNDDDKVDANRGPFLLAKMRDYTA